MKEWWPHVCDVYNITKFPTILILEMENITEAYIPRIYKGPKTFEGVKKELEPLALKRRIVRPGDRPKTFEDEMPREFPLTKDNYSSIIKAQDDFLFVHVYSDAPHQEWPKLPPKFE